MTNQAIQDIDLLIKELTALKHAATHADFDAAIEKLLQDQLESDAMPLDLKEVGSDVVLAYIASNFTIDMDINYCLILRDVHNSPCARWVNGEWIDV